MYISSGCSRREASSHQQIGSLQDITDVQTKPGVLHREILTVELCNGLCQVPAGRLHAKLLLGQVPLQIKPQVGLIAVVVHQAVGKMVVVGVSKGICQIVGQLAQGIVGEL